MLAASRRDDPLRHLLLEHECQREPPGRPRLRAQPAKQEGGADVVRKIGDDVGAFAGQLSLVDVKRILLDQRQAALMAVLELRKGWQAASRFAKSSLATA